MPFILWLQERGQGWRLQVGTSDVKLPPVVWPEERRVSFLEVILSPCALRPSAFLLDRARANRHSRGPCPSLPRFRVLCQTIIAHKLFDYVVLAFIFLNCITIALERPQIEAGSTVSGWGLRARQGTGRGAGHQGLLWDIVQGSGLGEISKAGIREEGEAGNLSLGRGTSPWAAKWQPPLGAPWRKAEVSRAGS